MIKTDYNKLASTYNKRYENNYLDNINDHLIDLITSNNYRVILETGCGTGRWIKSFKGITTVVYGLDSSVQMLKIAKNETNNFNLVNADAISFPFKNTIFDFIYCVNAIHHFPDKEKYISECNRTLSHKGMIAIIGVDPYIDKNWYVYDYFNTVYENDLKRFLSVKNIILILEEAGFINSSVKVVDEIYIKRIGTEVFNDPFLKKNHSSQLANLSDNEYELGIKKIKDQLNKNDKTIFETSIKFYLISAIKN